MRFIQTLSMHGWEIDYCATHGGVITRCQFNGADILRRSTSKWHQTFDPTLASCFPLLPYSNRISNGKFTYEGRDYRLKQNHSTTPYPLHGTSWLGAWQLVKIIPSCIVMSYDSKRDDWPWHFEATQTLEVEESTLTLSLLIRNLSESNMPAGMGFHPYFQDLKSATLNFHAAGVWDADEECLPTNLRKIPDIWNFQSGKSLAGVQLDNCFTDWAGEAKIGWKNAPLTLELTGDQNLDHAVVYTNEAEDYFCFEPVSHMNNAINRSESFDVTGLKHLGQNQSMHSKMQLRVLSE